MAPVQNIIGLPEGIPRPHFLGGQLLEVFGVKTEIIFRPIVPPLQGEVDCPRPTGEHHQPGIYRVLRHRHAHRPERHPRSIVPARPARHQGGNLRAYPTDTLAREHPPRSPWPRESQHPVLRIPAIYQAPLNLHLHPRRVGEVRQ